MANIAHCKHNEEPWVGLSVSYNLVSVAREIRTYGHSIVTINVTVTHSMSKTYTNQALQCGHKENCSLKFIIVYLVYMALSSTSVEQFRGLRKEEQKAFPFPELFVCSIEAS